MPSLRNMAEDLWEGKTSTHDPSHHPFKAINIIEEIAPNVAFYKSFSNLTVVHTGEGAVLIDTGSFHPTANKRSFDAVRSWTPQRVATAVYTHGHVDHAYGLPPFLKEASAQGWAPPEIVGHRRVREPDARRTFVQRARTICSLPASGDRHRHVQHRSARRRLRGSGVVRGDCPMAEPTGTAVDGAKRTAVPPVRPQLGRLP